MGEAGIPVLGYNFSLAGVCGRVTAPLGRGHAITLGMDGPAEDVPIPNGVIWNMVYDSAALRVLCLPFRTRNCGADWKDFWKM